MIFWNSLAFAMMQRMLAIWSLVPLAFLNPTYTSGSSRFTYCWSLAWSILNVTLLACEMRAIAGQFEHSLALPIFGIAMKSDLSQSCGHYWENITPQRNSVISILLTANDSWWKTLLYLDADRAVLTDAKKSRYKTCIAIKSDHNFQMNQEHCFTGRPMHLTY